MTPAEIMRALAGWIGLLMLGAGAACGVHVNDVGEVVVYEQDPDDPQGLVVIEAEHFVRAEAAGEYHWELDATTGSVGGAVVSLPVADVWLDPPVGGASPRLDYRVNFAAAGRLWLWVRGLWSTTGDHNSCHVGLDGAEPDGGENVSGSSTSWAWSRDAANSLNIDAYLDVDAPGEHVVNLWMRESDLRVDRLILTTDYTGFLPVGDGPPESRRR